MKEVDNEDDLMNILRATERVLVLFYASWCPFCRGFLPIFKEYARKNRRDEFLCVKIDDENNPLWEKYDVEVVPTIVLFEGERVQRRLDGVLGVGLTKDQFKDFLTGSNKADQTESLGRSNLT